MGGVDDQEAGGEVRREQNAVPGIEVEGPTSSFAKREATTPIQRGALAGAHGEATDVEADDATGASEPPELSE